MWEYLRLLLSAIVSNDSVLSDDSDKRILRHNIIELNRSTYLYVGKIISMSLVHGGPAPSFFSERVADYILFRLEKVKCRFEDVQDPIMRAKIQKVSMISIICNM